MLLVGAGLLDPQLRARCSRSRPASIPDGVLTLEVTLMPPKYPDTDRVLERLPRAVDAAGARAGGDGGRRRHVGAAQQHDGVGTDHRRRARAAAPNERFINVDQRAIAGDYFGVMQIPLLAGPRLHRPGHAHEPARRHRRRAHAARRCGRRGDARGQADPHRRHRRQRRPPPGSPSSASSASIKQDALDADSRMAVYFPQTQLTPRGIVA